jgi:hypothetical protein
MENSFKSIAVMQPYIFPYVGYFQLIKAVDEFVFYDDVNFIKQGWINRNKILINGKASVFTIPLLKASSFKLIKDTEINAGLYPKWKKKFLKSIQQNYTKAEYFEPAYRIIENVLSKNSVTTISELAIHSVKSISDYLELDIKFYTSSEKFPQFFDLERTLRLKQICGALGADVYINSIGGQDLYNKEDFHKEGLNLNFINSALKPYQQFENEFVAGLSIIDVLMFNSKEEVNKMLKNFQVL